MAVDSVYSRGKKYASKVKQYKDALKTERQPAMRKVLQACIKLNEKKLSELSKLK